MTAKKKPDPADGIPAGLGDKGTELWLRLTAEYSFEVAPEKALLLEAAARTADVVDRLQQAVDSAADLRVRGSQGQPVALPELTELRQYRGQLATLVKALQLPMMMSIRSGR
jgi:hypothetical protein